jgi:fatty-acyl-CoA synthase/long-chain acyl-CoA synthetase
VLTTSYRPADDSLPLVDLTIPALLADRAETCADTSALIGTSHDGSEVRLTWSELYAEVQHVATAIAKLASPGDYVALWSPNVVEWPLIQYGAAMAGVVLVALNPVLRATELEYALRHSGARVLIHADRSRDYDLAEAVATVASGFPDLCTISLSDEASWWDPVIDDEVVAAAPTDASLPVMLQYTSGTTGNPKGVLLRHRSLVNVAKLTMEFVGVEPGAVTVNPLPMFHTAACVIGTLGPLWLGGAEILVEQFVPGPVLSLLRKEQPDVLFNVPAVLGALLEAQRLSDEPAPQIARVIGGAATLPASMVEAVEEVFGARVTNLFGQTELSPVLTATRGSDSREDQLGTVGHPLPQVDVKIVGPSGEVLPLGESGEICARGYQQLIEYLGDAAATSACVDEDGFVHTGDLGAMDSRGYLTLTGRLKDLIIRGGENIAPASIESCLVGHPAVLEATVIGLPDDALGEIVAAVVRVRGDEPADLGESLREYAREHLSPYKVPSRWFVAEELPVTPTGKVQKFAVVDRVGAGRLREV